MPAKFGKKPSETGRKWQKLAEIGRSANMRINISNSMPTVYDDARVARTLGKGGYSPPRGRLPRRRPPWLPPPSPGGYGVPERFAPQILTDAPAAGPAVAGVRKQDFLNVMQRSCVRCHQVCGTVEGMVGNGWIRPGDPAASRTFTVIGVTRRPGATYHNLPDRDKTIVRDYIQQMKR